MEISAVSGASETGGSRFAENQVASSGNTFNRPFITNIDTSH